MHPPPGDASATGPDTPIPDPPRSIGDWRNFFARLGFAGKQLGKPETRAAMQSWAGRGLTQGAMREVMLRAHECNRGRPPVSPLYYASFIDDWFAHGGRLRVALHGGRGAAPGAAAHPLDATLRAMQPPAAPRPPIEPI